MSDLILDLAALQQLQHDLVNSMVAFDDAPSMSRDLADAVGHDGRAAELSGKVNDFSSGWEIRRTKIRDAMDAVTKAVATIHNTFAEIDQKLTDGLTGAKS